MRLKCKIAGRRNRLHKSNEKWLSDITEFAILAGKVYLSPIVDCFDGMVVAWTAGTNPNVDLVNEMLIQAVSKLKDNKHPIVHTNRGCHYRWLGWIELMEKNSPIKGWARDCVSDFV